LQQAATATHRLFAAVAVDDVTSATVALTDGTTTPADVNERHVISWAGPVASEIERVDARMRDGRTVVCEELRFPDDPTVPDDLGEFAGPFSCKVTGRAG
jgi:hypothetical protein